MECEEFILQDWSLPDDPASEDDGGDDDAGDDLHYKEQGLSYL